MAESSRTSNSVRNAIISICSQAILLIINFVTRTFFIQYLGVEILGINSLYANLLNLLSMAELGFGSAIIYGMYKPIKERDKIKICALLNFYKKVYRVVIIIIFSLGIAIVPFLQYIVNSELPYSNVLMYYLLFLANTLCSYLFAYKSSVIIAHQKSYITKLILSSCAIVKFIAQLIAIIVFQNYIAFLLIEIVATFSNNLICSILADKLHPYIKQKSELTKPEKTKIYKNVGSIFLYKVSGTVLNNTDNIYISTLINTTMVGYYTNYYTVTSALSNLIFIIFNSVTASVGNLMVEKDHQKKSDVFMQLNFICFIFTAICTVCLFGLLESFISLWIGSEFILDPWITGIIIANFYLYTMQNPVWVYRDTTGLFKDASKDTIYLTISNIVLSFIFGKLFGLFGILFATFISRLLITAWHQPYLLYKKVLHTSMRDFIIKNLYYIFIVLVCLIPTFFIKSLFPSHSLPMFILKAILMLSVDGVLLFLFLYKTKEAKKLFSQLKRLLSRKN